MAPKKSSDPVARAVAKLPKSKGTLSESAEQAILGHGAAAIAPLLEVMNDYEVESYAPMHAARLLGQLKAEAAIEPMIEIIIETDWDDRLHDAAILALGEIGPAIVEPILARWTDFPDGDDEVRPALLGALASCGAKDERVYQLLLKEFEASAWRTAGELAAYGDERAIPVISKALDESRFGVDGEELHGRAVIDLCDSIEELGGELSPAQQERLDQVRAQLRARHDKHAELSADDAELSDLLDSNEDAMTLAAAKGFLTAIVSGPTTTMPSAWLDLVLGEDPTFDSQEHADRILGLLMNLHNQLIAHLDEGKPVAPSEPEDEVEEWCAGYLEAAEMDSAWMADEEALTFLFPMSVLSGDFSLIGETDAQGKVIEDPTPQVNACRARLDRSAHDAYQYWLAWRRSRSTVPVVRKDPKVGRNEPCPCGSGKKYKKCCGLVN